MNSPPWSDVRQPGDPEPGQGRGVLSPFFLGIPYPRQLLVTHQGNPNRSALGDLVDGEAGLVYSLRP
ncbi:MAG: hypothetical protein AB1445_09875 [Bacillota bacterium]